MLRVTRDQAHTIATRHTLLQRETEIVKRKGITWADRLREMGDYGKTGGEAGERRLIVQGMTQLEHKGMS